MITLQQAFYGRESGKGYCILASSDAKYNRMVEQICASIGTPDGITELKPFYINYIDGNTRYMIRGCTGNPDDSGRKTLFFHALIGNHQELKEANTGIGLLIQDKIFASQCNDNHPLSAYKLEERNYSVPWANVSFAWNNEKVAIRSNKEEFDLLTGLLKNQLNTLSWASLSFRPLELFRVYILSEYSPIMPSDRKVIDINGTPIKTITAVNKSRPMEVVSPSSNNHAVLKIFFVLSLLFNITLAWLLWQANNSRHLASRRQQVEVHNTQQEQLDDDTENSIIDWEAKKERIRQEVITELRQEFLRTYTEIPVSLEYQIMNNTKNQELKIHYTGRRDKGKAKQVLVDANNYVIFVNSQILNTNQGEGENE